MRLLQRLAEMWWVLRLTATAVVAAAPVAAAASRNCGGCQSHVSVNMMDADVAPGVAGDGKRLWATRGLLFLSSLIKLYQY